MHKDDSGRETEPKAFAAGHVQRGSLYRLCRLNELVDFERLADVLEAQHPCLK